MVPNVENIRPLVDHISVVWQSVSNFGNEISRASRKALEELERKKLVDTFFRYNPDLSKGGGKNEFRKRQIGVEMARQAGASHFIFLDADEFYKTDEFDAAKQFIEKNNISFSSVALESYYGRPTWQLEAPERGFVSFICALNMSTRHEFGGNYPDILVDPTRRAWIEGGQHKIFEPSEIVMHHMTGIRLDIEEKLANSSFNDNQVIAKDLSEKFKYLPKIKPGHHKIPDGTEFGIREVEDIFGLEKRLLPDKS